MASSRAESPTVAPTSAAFALQELAACWDQGYEALARGDLERVAALLDLAQEHLAKAGDASHDSPRETALRSAAAAANGRLQHGMKAGLVALRDELARARTGGKALRGYGDSVARPSDGMRRDA